MDLVIFNEPLTLTWPKILLVLVASLFHVSNRPDPTCLTHLILRAHLPLICPSFATNWYVVAQATWQVNLICKHNHAGPYVQQQSQFGVDSPGWKQHASHNCEDWKRQCTSP